MCAYNPFSFPCLKCNTNKNRRLYRLNKEMKLYFQTKSITSSSGPESLPAAPPCQASFILMHHDFAKQISGWEIKAQTTALLSNLSGPLNIDRVLTAKALKAELAGKWELPVTKARHLASCDFNRQKWPFKHIFIHSRAVHSVQHESIISSELPTWDTIIHLGEAPLSCRRVWK